MAKEPTKTEVKPLAPKKNKKSPLLIMAEQYNIEPEKLLPVLRNTVLKPDKHGREATNEELAAFVMVCNRYKLDPFRKQIFGFVDKSGGVVPVVGVDGWATIVNGTKMFEGCEFEEHLDEEDNFLGTSCTIYTTGRDKPVKITEWLIECRRKTENWDNMPRRMTRHKSFIQASRLAFAISGIYDEDEARDILARTSAPADPLLPPSRKSKQTIPPPPEMGSEAAAAKDPAPTNLADVPKGHHADSEDTAPVGDAEQALFGSENDSYRPITGAQIKRLWAICSESKIDTTALHKHIYEQYGFESIKQIPVLVYEELCDWAVSGAG